MPAIIGIFQFYCKYERKQDMFKSGRIFPYLQKSALFKLLLKFVLDKVYLKNE